MRRVSLALILALVLAVVLGRVSVSHALEVSGSRVSQGEVAAELAAIQASPVLQCYLTAASPASYGVGAGSGTMAASGAAAWLNMRVQGLAIERYVATTLHHTPSGNLASAQTSLEQELTQAAQANHLSCPGSASQALAAMPSAMRSFELQSQASSLYLISKLNSTIPLTTASLQAYYASHRSSYDTLCISVALVNPSQVNAFHASQAAGLSVAQLAKKYSLDPSGAKGGAYGCYSPTSTSYGSVRADVANLALDTFPTTPGQVNLGGSIYALYVAVTQRSTTPFATAEPAVLNDVRTYNASAASTVRDGILYRAAVTVDPAFGRWGLASTGPVVGSAALPSVGDVTSATTLSTAGSLSYR